MDPVLNGYREPLSERVLNVGCRMGNVLTECRVIEMARLMRGGTYVDMNDMTYWYGMFLV